jgi:two-component system nitrate/nitrite response regulator NarL
MIPVSGFARRASKSGGAAALRCRMRFVKKFRNFRQSKVLQAPTFEVNQFKTSVVNIMSEYDNLRCALVAATEDDKLLYYWERALHDICEIFVAPSLETLREHLEDYKPSLVVLDLTLPFFTLQEMPRLLKISPSTKILIFSPRFDEQEAVTAITLGAKGYAQNNSDIFLLRKAVEVIKKGELWIPRHFVTKLFRQMQATVKQERESSETTFPNRANTSQSSSRLDQLTKREQQIAELIGNGCSNKEISSLLKISESTVKAHLSAIYHKLGLVDRLSLALFVTQGKAAEEPISVD